MRGIINQSELNKLFPKTARYNSEWVKQNSLLHNTLLYTESLCNALDIKEEQRVLDLGCGKAVSSIFLAKEYNVQVWAVDREISPTENYIRIKEMSCENNVFPLQLDARRLPFPKNFFDVVISIDSFSYYATDNWYLPYLSQFIKPGGMLAFSEWCCSKEFNNVNEVPEYLQKCYTGFGFHGMHSIEWWKNHFTKIGLFEVINSDILPGNKYILEDFIQEFENMESEREIVKALQQDTLNIINTFRIVGKRTEVKAYLDDFEDTQTL